MRLPHQGDGCLPWVAELRCTDQALRLCWIWHLGPDSVALEGGNPGSLSDNTAAGNEIQDIMEKAKAVKATFLKELTRCVLPNLSLIQHKTTQGEIVL